MSGLDADSVMKSYEWFIQSQPGNGVKPYSEREGEAFRPPLLV